MLQPFEIYITQGYKKIHHMAGDGTNDVAYSIVYITPKNVAYTDLTGRFPYRSSRGNEYILVLYHYDGNAILLEPL